MSGKWINKRSNKNANSFRGGRPKKKSQRNKKNSKKQSSVNSFRPYVEDPEEVAEYTNRNINLDPDPENQEARIAKLTKEMEILEKDLAPLTDQEKRGIREILKED